jgi:hypothetical protein
MSVSPEARRNDGPVSAAGEAGPPTQSALLVQIALRNYRLGCDPQGDGFAVELAGPNLALALRGRGGLRQALADAFYNREGKPPSTSALTDAINVLEGRARRLDREPVSLRVAEYADGFVLDLGTADGRCVVVTPGKWRVERRSPVLFRRSALTRALPDPAPGGTIENIRSVLRVGEADFPLLLAWLAATLLPGTP